MIFKYFVYILRCEDGTLYTGYTNNLHKRYRSHINGIGARYTRNHKPKEIVYKEKFQTKSDALKREFQIKNLKRSEKLDLISSFVNSAKVI